MANGTGTKRLIVFGGDKRMAAVAYSGAKRYLFVNKVQVCHLKMYDVVTTNVPRMFGLMHGMIEYVDRMDEELPDFFGMSPNQAVEEFKSMLYRVGGTHAFGRILSRQIRFETQMRLFMLQEYDNALSLATLEREPSLVKDGLLLIICGEATDMYTTKNAVTLPIDDLDTLHLLVRGTIKRFLDLEE